MLAHQRARCVVGRDRDELSSPGSNVAPPEMQEIIFPFSAVASAWLGSSAAVGFTTSEGGLDEDEGDEGAGISYYWMLAQPVRPRHPIIIYISPLIAHPLSPASVYAPTHDYGTADHVRRTDGFGSAIARRSSRITRLKNVLVGIPYAASAQWRPEAYSQQPEARSCVLDTPCIATI